MRVCRTCALGLGQLRVPISTAGHGNVKMCGESSGPWIQPGSAFANGGKWSPGSPGVPWRGWWDLMIAVLHAHPHFSLQL